MAVSLAVLPRQVLAPAADRVRRKARHILVCRTVASRDPTWQGEGSLGRNLLEVGLVLLVPGHRRAFVSARACAVNTARTTVLYATAPVRAETLRVGPNEFTVRASWNPVAHIQPVLQPQGKHLLLVRLILLWGERRASIVIAHNP